MLQQSWIRLCSDLITEKKNCEGDNFQLIFPKIVAKTVLFNIYTKFFET